MIRAEPAMLHGLVSKIKVERDGSTMRLPCPLKNHTLYIEPGATELGDGVWCDGGCDPAEVVDALDYLVKMLPDRCRAAEDDLFHHRGSCLRCQRYEPALKSAMRYLIEDQARKQPVADSVDGGAPTTLHQQRLDWRQADRWAQRKLADDEDGDDDGEGWAAQSLINAEPVAPPTILEVGEGSGQFLIRENTITGIHGPFAVGKTPLAYLAVVQEIRKGNCVLIIDHEMADSQAVLLLREFGLSDQEINEGIHYVYDPPPPTKASRLRLIAEILARQEATGRRFTLAVIDSLTQSMATVPGSDDNKASDVTTWPQRLGPGPAVPRAGPGRPRRTVHRQRPGLRGPVRTGTDQRPHQRRHGPTEGRRLGRWPTRRPAPRARRKHPQPDHRCAHRRPRLDSHCP